MGIEINISNSTLAIPWAKMDEIVQICEQFHGRTECSRWELQSLLGKLLYVSKIIKPARGFLNRMLNTLRGMPQFGKGGLDEDFVKDLNWFWLFLRGFNGSCTYSSWGESE